MHNNLEQIQGGEDTEITYSVLLEQSIYSLYRVQIGKKRYVAKVYPACRVALLGQELSLLQTMNHPNIIKPMMPDSSLAPRLASIFHTDLILFPEVARGSLLTYLQVNKALSQNITKFFLAKIVGALLYAQKEAGVSHPNLTLGNILLDEGYNIFICGWSNSLQVKKDVPFALAEIAVSMLTGRSPFVCKDIKVDPYGKFLTDKLIHKFWEQSEKFTRKLNKNFSFSPQFKTIVGDMFLGKLKSLEKVSEIYLQEKVMSIEEVQKQLEENENSVKEKKKEKRLNEKKQYLEEQELAIEAEELVLNRQASRSHGVFIQQYNQLKQEEEMKLTQKDDSDNRQYFQLIFSDSRMVIAHLKAKIAEAYEQQKDQYFVDPLLILQEDWSVEVEGKDIKVHLPFSWNFAEIDSKDGLSSVQIDVSLALARVKDSLWGTIGKIDCPDLNATCEKWVFFWIRQALELYQ